MFRIFLFCWYRTNIWYQYRFGTDAALVWILSASPCLCRVLCCGPAWCRVGIYWWCCCVGSIMKMLSPGRVLRACSSVCYGGLEVQNTAKLLNNNNKCISHLSLLNCCFAAAIFLCWLFFLLTKDCTLLLILSLFRFFFPKKTDH